MQVIRSSQSLFWMLAGVLVAISGNSVFAADPPAQPGQNAKKADPLFPFTISKETTRIVKPLKQDGTPDYATALNARLSEGVTTGNNAAAILFPFIAPEDMPADQQNAIAKKLGIALGKNRRPLQNIGKYAESQWKDEQQSERDKLWDAQSAAMSRPWSRKEFPLVSGWVDANSAVLSAALEASGKDQFFVPLVVGEEDTLVSVPLSHMMEMRSLARLLTARAMLLVNEGEIEKAQADLLACHRLAGLMSKQPTLIESLVGIAIDAVASEGDNAMAASPKISAKQLAAYRKELEQLPPLPPMSEKIDLGERFMFLDAICNLATQKMEAKALGIPNNKLVEKMMRLAIDWDLIMKRGNKEYDKIVAAMNQPAYAARKAAVEKMDAELKKLQADAQSPAQIALSFLGVDPPRQVVSRQMGNILITLLIPSIHQAGVAEVRGRTKRDLTLVALALAEYRLDHKSYPESLKDLSPKYLKTLPEDRFNQKPLAYRTTEQGYVLYSVGPNGIDDKGQPRGETQTSDDLVVRVPIQKR